MSDLTPKARKLNGPEPASSETARLSVTGDSDEAAADELRDRMLGEFRLLRRLGRGGMAEVYLAEQTSLHRQVAVKVLRADKVADTDDVLLKRFEQEARAAAALTHPNIVQVYSIGQQEGIHYIAQEYVQGMNLKDFLRKKGPPELPIALHFMKQIAAALQRAADAGIVHRDVKPENIMITRKGSVKVADFGLAQLTHAGDGVNLTQVGVTMGTPLYMSPEQIQGHKVDHRSDLYAFGVTCYHLLSGHPPFRGETALSIAVQHLKSDPQPLVEVRPDLPPALAQIVHRLMAKAPSERYSAAQSVLRDLKQIEAALKDSPASLERLELGHGAGLRALAERAARRFTRWSPGRRLVAYGAACLLLALPAAALGWWLRPGNPLEAPAATASLIPVANSAQEQYFLALAWYSRDNEYAWHAVIDNFPDDAEYVPKAQEQLAQLYLKQLRLDEAERLFNVLSNHSERHFQAVGFAGRAVIANLRGNYQYSQSLIDGQVKPRRDAFDPGNDELERYVQQAERLNEQHLSA